METKQELIRGFLAAAKLAESLEPISKNEATKAIEEQKSHFSSDFMDLPPLPHLNEDTSIDEDLMGLIGITSKKIAEQNSTAKGMSADALRMAQAIEKGEVDLEEANQILCMMTEDLDKKVETFLEAQQSELEEAKEESEEETQEAIQDEEPKEEPKEEKQEEPARKGADFRVYDNGGQSFDRYTLVVDRGGHSDFYGLGSDVGPGGFNQFLGSSEDGYKEGDHLGNLVEIDTIPAKVKKAIMDRVGMNEVSEAAGVQGLDPMTRHYLVTMLWAETDNADEQGGEPFDKNFDITDIEDKSVEQAKKDCDEFYKKAQAALEKEGFDIGELDLETLGHDFWLTRNRHGAGFWDGDYEKRVGEILTDLSHKFGERWPGLTGEVGDPETKVVID